MDEIDDVDGGDGFGFGFAAGGPGGGFAGALRAGTAYALYRHGQDRQTAQLLRALRDLDPTVEVEVRLPEGYDEDRSTRAVDPTRFEPGVPGSFKDFLGQQRLKDRLTVHIDSAKVRLARLPPLLFTSTAPGMGKRTLARVVAAERGVRIFELVPPFPVGTLVETARALGEREVLYVDEAHLLGNRATEVLVGILERQDVPDPEGGSASLRQFSVVAATSAPDALPLTLAKCFPLTMAFEEYTWAELSGIATDLAWRNRVLDDLDDDLAVELAEASGGRPGVLEGLVLTARDLFLARGAAPAAAEVLDLLGLPERDLR